MSESGVVRLMAQPSQEKVIATSRFAKEAIWDETDRMFMYNNLRIHPGSVKVTNMMNATKIQSTKCTPTLVIDFRNSLESFITRKDGAPVVQRFHSFTPTTVLSGNGCVTN